MSRARPLALAAAAVLAGCPLPQPLPDFPTTAVTPPRIIVDDSRSQISSPEVVVRVPSNCPTPPMYLLAAQVRDVTSATLGIDVRWFVNYDPTNSARYTWLLREEIRETDPSDPTLLHLTPFTFFPYDFDSVSSGPGRLDPGALRVVELVTSNGFFSTAPFAPPSMELVPNRSPRPGFEIQVYRWVFLNVPEPVPCVPGNPGCCPP